MISSTTNSQFKTFKKLLSDPKYRQEQGNFILENRRFVEELYRQAPERIEALIISEEAQIPAGWQGAVIALAPSIFNQLSTLKTHQGIMAQVKRPEEVVFQPGWQRLCILDGIQNPANLGAIIRNAVAFNIEALLLTPNCADPYHPEALRAMAGLFYQCPILRLNEEILTQLRQHAFYLLEASATTTLNTLKPEAHSVFVLGAEGQGVTHKGVREMAKSVPLRIEMNAGVESLNVGVVSGIVFSWRP